MGNKFESPRPQQVEDVHEEHFQMFMTQSKEQKDHFLFFLK